MNTRNRTHSLLYLLLCAVVALAAPVHAQTIQAVYSDALQNGWADWSWCQDSRTSTTYVHSGTYSIAVTYNAAWTGFYLEHAAFDSTPYTNLTFWINGGQTSGRTITVAGLLGGTAQAAVPLSNYVTVQAGTWKHVVIPLADLKVSNKTNMSGFWLQEAAGTTQPTFYVDDISLTGPAVTTAILIDAGAGKHPIDPRIYGVAYATAAQLTALNCPLNRDRK